MKHRATTFAVAWVLPGMGLAASWQGLFPPTGSAFDQTYGTAISADGSVVVGYARNSSSGITQAFRWTATGGLMLLGTTSADGTAFSSTSACCVSADGSIVAGSGTTVATGSDAIPLQWSVSTPGSNSLRAVASTFSNNQVRALSPDGTVMGGTGNGSAASGFCVASSSQPALWPSPGPSWDTAGLPVGTNAGDVHSISSLGTVVVGDVYDICAGLGAAPQAFAWTATAGYALLGVLPNGTFSVASAISPDGTVITGYSGNSASSQAFTWTRAAGMIGLGASSPATGQEIGLIPTGISADGTIVVGNNPTSSNPTAPSSPPELWTPTTGALSLHELLLQNGLFVPPEYLELNNLAGISADGNWVVGTATAQRAGLPPVAFVSYIGLSPPPPASLEVVASAAGTITLSWQPVAGATDYLVTVDGNGAAQTTATMATLSGLSAGGTYTVAVEVITPQGQSAPSNAVSIGVSPGDGEISVTWVPVPGAIKYVVGISTTPGAESSATSACPDLCGTAFAASMRAGTVTGLKNGQTYYVKVFAEAAVGRPMSSSEAAAIPAGAVSGNTGSGDAGGGGGELELLSLVALGSMMWLRLNRVNRLPPQHREPDELESDALS